MLLEFSEEEAYDYERAVERKVTVLAALDDLKQLIQKGGPPMEALEQLIEQIRKNEVSY